MPERSAECLIRHAKESYCGSFNVDLLEQYKLYVQSAENVSARRVASSRYLLTINAALVALYGILPAGFGESYRLKQSSQAATTRSAGDSPHA